MSTRIPYYLYMSLRKAADQVGLTVQQTLDLTRVAREDGFELDFTTAPPAGFQQIMPKAAAQSETPARPTAPTEGYTNRQAQNLLTQWVRTAVRSGVPFTRDEAIKEALFLHASRDRLLLAHPSRGGALTVVTHLLASIPGVMIVRNEKGCLARDPLFTYTKKVA